MIIDKNRAGCQVFPFPCFMVSGRPVLITRVCLPLFVNLRYPDIETAAFICYYNLSPGLASLGDPSNDKGALP
jgi:hypothetical protein